MRGQKLLEFLSRKLLLAVERQLGFVIEVIIKLYVALMGGVGIDCCRKVRFKP